MKASAVIALIIIGSIGLVFCAVQAQPISLVYGQVKDAAGNPLPNSPIVIEGIPVKRWSFWTGQPVRFGQAIKLVAITDSAGKFQLVDLPPGSYVVKYSKVGSEPAKVAQFDLQHGYQTYYLGDRLQLKETLTPEQLYRAPTQGGTSAPGPEPVPMPKDPGAKLPLK